MATRKRPRSARLNSNRIKRSRHTPSVELPMDVWQYEIKPRLGLRERAVCRQLSKAHRAMDAEFVVPAWLGELALGYKMAITHPLLVAMECMKWPDLVPVHASGYEIIWNLPWLHFYFEIWTRDDMWDVTFSSYHAHVKPYWVDQPSETLSTRLGPLMHRLGTTATSRDECLQWAADLGVWPGGPVDLTSLPAGHAA